jgi:hypothetical protein
MMKSALTAVVLATAMTALSLSHRWQGIDSTFRGFPFLCVNVISGDSYQNSAGPGTDIWRLVGYGPLVTNWFVWMLLSTVSLRLVKGTASALVSVAAIQCAMGFLQWWKQREYFNWTTSLIVSFTVGIYLLLGYYARRSQIAAAYVGVGLYAALLGYQAYHGLVYLLNDLVFQVPTIVLLVLAVLAALRQQAGRTKGNPVASR